jgi:hypothetical protein
MEGTQHGPALAMRHAVYTTEEFGNDTTDRTTAQNGVRVAAISGDEFVIRFDGRFNPDRDSFLHSRRI